MLFRSLQRFETFLQEVAVAADELLSTGGQSLTETARRLQVDEIVVALFMEDILAEFGYQVAGVVRSWVVPSE